MLERIPIAALLLILLACTPEPPSEVFVPGPGFVQTLRITTEQGDTARVRVDEPLVLHGQRSSGPWVRVEYASLAPDACWLVAPPDATEPEVAGNLRWLVEPEGDAKFNLGLRGDMTRDVAFRRPGVYRLSARSGAWCDGTESETVLTVTVVER